MFYYLSQKLSQAVKKDNYLIFTLTTTSLNGMKFLYIILLVTAITIAVINKRCPYCLYIHTRIFTWQASENIPVAQAFISCKVSSFNLQRTEPNTSILPNPQLKYQLFLIHKSTKPIIHQGIKSMKQTGKSTWYEDVATPKKKSVGNWLRCTEEEQSRRCNRSHGKGKSCFIVK